MVHSAVQSSRGGTSERLSSIRGSSVLQSSVDYSLHANSLYEQCQALKWFEESLCFNSAVLGAAVRCPDDGYIFEPESMEESMKTAIQALASPVAFTMASAIASKVFSQISPYQTELIIQPRGARIPIVDTVDNIQDRGFEIRQTLACLVKQDRVILLLANTVDSAIAHGQDIEQMLMETVWGSSFGPPRALSRPMTEARFSYLSLNEIPEATGRTPAPTPSVYFTGHQKHDFSTHAKKLMDRYSITIEALEEKADEEFVDPETAKVGHARRPMILTHSVMVGLGLILLIAVESLIISKTIAECKLDQWYIRLAFLAVMPIYAGFALCSVLLIIFSVFQVLSPLTDNKGNSRYYSASAPDPLKFGDVDLPHITIQIPVFMEGLTGVIVPTITSIKRAIKYYESVGGTASIYINDDGMQIIHPDIAEARRRYYAQNHIGWCARPPHVKDGFIRKGRFKKASNMNYCLDFSNRVEDELVRLMAQKAEVTTNEETSIEQENDLYQQALDTIIESDEGRTMACGNVRIGEIILLVDIDTRVPQTCLHMGALELLESPDIAIVQHTSGVLRVAHNLFETGISFLTDLVYTAIAFNCGSGDYPCFLGHNAFLRWKAIQSVAFQDSDSGGTKFWSEDHVSEDFQLSLKLQTAGFGMRLASYHGEEFKEGVSLTVFDELARWEKYAYGINELVFNPLRKFYKGPITGTYLKYFMSSVKPSSKLMVLSYTFTYYALAIPLPLTLANYLLVGWFPGTLDQFYITSWKIIVVMLIIFNVISPIAYCIVRHRLHWQPLRSSIPQIITCTPLIILFFSGISFHLTKALLSHFVGSNIEWTATAKELETTGFFIGIDRIAKDFKYMYIMMLAVVGGMVYLGVYAPSGWTITDWTAIVPLGVQVVCHSLLPIALGLF